MGPLLSKIRPNPRASAAVIPDDVSESDSKSEWESGMRTPPALRSSFKQTTGVVSKPKVAILREPAEVEMGINEQKYDTMFTFQKHDRKLDDLRRYYFEGEPLKSPEQFQDKVTPATKQEQFQQKKALLSYMKWFACKVTKHDGKTERGASAAGQRLGVRVHRDVRRMAYTGNRKYYVTAGEGTDDPFTVRYNQPALEYNDPSLLDYTFSVSYNNDAAYSDFLRYPTAHFQCEILYNYYDTEERFPVDTQGLELIKKKFSGTKPLVIECRRFNERSAHRFCLLWNTVNMYNIQVYVFDGNGTAPTGDSSTNQSKVAAMALINFILTKYYAGLSLIPHYTIEPNLVNILPTPLHGHTFGSYTAEPMEIKKGSYMKRVHVYFETNSKQMGAKDCKRHTLNTISRLLATNPNIPNANTNVKATSPLLLDILDWLAIERENEEKTHPGYNYPRMTGLPDDKGNWKDSGGPWCLEDDVALVMHLYKLTKGEHGPMKARQPNFETALLF